MKWIKILTVFTFCSSLVFISKRTGVSLLNNSIQESFYSNKEVKWRKVASNDLGSSDLDCNAAITTFQQHNGISLGMFKEYKEFFDAGGEKPFKFSNLEMYLAFLESKANDDNISFTRYFLSLNYRELRYNEFMITKVGHRKYLSYFFNGYMKSLIDHSLRLDNLGEFSNKNLERALREKILTDAIAKIDDENSRFSKFMHSEGFKHLVNWLGVIPLAFGGPPFYLPKSINSDVLAKLLKSRDPKTLMEDFDNLDYRSNKFLQAHYFYNDIWIYLNVGVAALFVYDLIQEVHENVEIMEDSKVRLKQTEVAFKEAIDILSESNSCRELDQCLEKYASFWRGKSDDARNEVVESCKKSHMISEQCF